MSRSADASSTLGVAVMVVLMVVGFVLLWRLIVSPAARARRQPAALTDWPGSASDLLLFFLLAICGAIGLPALAGFALYHRAVSAGTLRVVNLAAFQLGFLVGLAVYHFFFRRGRLERAELRGIWGSGAATVLIALPLVQGSALIWQALLGWWGLPVETPENIQMFIDLPTPVLRVAFGIIAVAVVPIGEELVFRAGLFRYFRGRFPRGIALFIPAFVFGAMHLFPAPLESLGSLAPLVTLAIVLSLAYERTGRIGTTMVAHALFNLIMLGLVLLGVNT